MTPIPMARQPTPTPVRILRRCPACHDFLTEAYDCPTCTRLCAVAAKRITFTAPLELDRPIRSVAPPAMPEPAEPERPRRRRLPVALAAVLLLAGAAVATWSIQDRSAPRHVVLTIDSDPPGATVTINGELAGRTPFFEDNIYPAVAVPVVITHPGHRPWKGSFTGGREARIGVRLERR